MAFTANLQDRSELLEIFIDKSTRAGEVEPVTKPYLAYCTKEGETLRPI